MRQGSCRAWLGIPGTCMLCAGLRSWQEQHEGGAQPSTRSDLRLKQRLNADRASLIEQDLANVHAGVYPLPADHDGSLFTMLDRSWLFFRDLPEVDERRRRSATHEVLNAKTRGRRPDYYLQNFHFQSGGWLTEEFRRPLRHPGRGVVQGNGQRHAAAVLAPVEGSFRRTRPAQIATH